MTAPRDALTAEQLDAIEALYQAAIDEMKMGHNSTAPLSWWNYQSAALNALPSLLAAARDGLLFRDIQQRLRDQSFLDAYNSMSYTVKDDSSGAASLLTIDGVPLEPGPSWGLTRPDAQNGIWTVTGSGEQPGSGGDTDTDTASADGGR